VLQLSTGYVRVIVWPLALWGVALVLNATLNGAGDTLLPALFTGFMLIPGRYGLALLLAPRYGLDGIWWSVAITMAGSGLGFLFYYSRNRWIRVAERKLGAAQLERPARSPPLSSEPT
jgi:Na+-driven multidrug efflux pump